MNTDKQLWVIHTHIYIYIYMIAHLHLFFFFVCVCVCVFIQSGEDQVSRSANVEQVVLSTERVFCRCDLR